MHYSIILNPAAGNGNGAQVWQTIKHQLIQADADFDLHTSKGKDSNDAEYFASRLAQSQDANQTTVIVVGGDGTLHDALTGLMHGAHNQHSDLLPLAYIPVSNSSRFARAYGISLDPVKALQQILATKQIESISVGRCRDAIKNEDSYFLNSIGIGFDAALISHAQKRQKRQRFRWGRPSFFSHALAVLYNQQPFQLMVNEPQQRFLYPKAYIATITNHPFTDSRVKIAVANNLKRPVLGLTVAERHNWLMTFWQLIQYYRGTLPTSRFAEQLSSPSFHCTTTSLEFSQADGESQGNRFIDITVDTIMYPFRQGQQKEK